MTYNRLSLIIDMINTLLYNVSMELDLFHGTDEEYALKIVNDRFICKDNRYHWLGNGIYFYTDQKLAEWWTSKPSKKFGNVIKTKAIVQCKVNIDDEFVLDLRKLSDYRLCVDYFKKFFNFYIGVAEKAIDSEKLRCTFFDILFQSTNTKMIIGNYNLPTQDYLTEIDPNFFKITNLSYIETQVCISDDSQDIIKDKTYYILR